MENAYHPEAWHELYVALCGACAALAGLLFIATSLNAETLIDSKILRSRAGFNTFLIVFLVVEAALVLVPQGRIALSVELLVLIALLVPIYIWGIVLLRRAGFRRLPPRAYVVPATAIVGIMGALSLAFGAGGGMYIVTFFSLAQLAFVMWNAWGLLLAAKATEQAAK